MKKVIIIALLAIGLTGFAQEGKKKKGREQTTEMRMKKITEELALTEDQQKQMVSVLGEQEAMKKAEKENPESKQENKGKMKEMNKKIKGILSAEQFEKWEALKKNQPGKKEHSGKKEKESQEE